MKSLTPVKAIRAKCIECSGDDKAEVRLCTFGECPLWPYRMGRRPKKGHLAAGDGEPGESPVSGEGEPTESSEMPS